MDEIGVPKGVAELTVPKPPPIPGLRRTFRFVGGSELTIDAPEDAWTVASDRITVITLDGRTLDINRAHVMVMETKAVSLAVRKAKVAS